MKYLFNSYFTILLVLIACQPPGELYEDALCIENITTIDPVAGLKDNQTIIIQEGKILHIASTQQLRLSKKNTILDGTGKFLIPGLWDAHVHFAYLEDLAPRMFDLFLAWGITSVRDTGGEISFVKKWKDQSLANPTTTPRVMIAGPLLDGMPNVYDGSDPSRPPLSVGLKSVDDVENKIEELYAQDVDLLKAYEMLQPEQFRRICELARAKGLKVTGHVPLSMDVINASNAGMNSMEHLRNLELSCASNADELLAQRMQLLHLGKNDPGGILRSRIHQAQRQNAIENYDDSKADEVLEVLAENDTWQIPTLALSTGITKRHFAEPEWQESFSYLPETIEEQWKMRIEEMSENEISKFNKTYTQWTLDIVGKIHKKGIGIMAGTDCPIFFLTPGRSLHQELAMLVEAGLSPLEALKTATINPAKYFGIEDELGSIKPKMWADLVILNANPLEDIQNTLKIHAVIKQGKAYTQEELLSRLE